MILRLARNSRDDDADLRQSYRQRLDEILESDRAGSGGQDPLMEPVTAASPVMTAMTEFSPPAAVAVHETAPTVFSQGPGVRQDEPAPAAAESADKTRNSAADTLSQVAEKLALSLVEGLAAIMNSQEQRRATEADRLEKRFETLRMTIQSQTELISGLAATNERLLRNQQTVEQRLNNQAQVIRELNSLAAAQQSRWNAYQAAVDKLKEINNLPVLLAQLPDDL